jgi:HTH-type transcriptional regulator / antitoxin HigA
MVLIEKFEQSHYAPPATCPQSMLRFLMEQRQLEASDLRDVLGSTTTVTDILTGTIPIDPQQAELLGKFFQVDPELFQAG